ncbi:hypothetical protein PUN28_006101 [Cardiocondyla obscurior]|uniref:Uncharacterized protein n=2 Tax=Cardiocondyla obscurior TaxID=286306 RepID=A0AAW2GC77_9HYME
MLSNSERNIRRNLKFTKTPISATESKKCVKTGINNNDNNPKKENAYLSRKSFLLPPNTIKEFYVKNRFTQNRFEVSQLHSSPVSSENINFKISKISTNDLTLTENTNTDNDSTICIKEKKMSITQNIPSQAFNINEQSGINILHTSSSDSEDTFCNLVNPVLNLNPNKMSNVDICGSENNVCSVIIKRSLLLSGDDADSNIIVMSHNDNNINQNNTRANHHSSTICVSPVDAEKKVKDASLIKKDEKENCSSKACTIVYEKDLNSSLQAVRLTEESVLNLQRSFSEDDECVSLSKRELIVLESKLKHLVSRFQEDLLSLNLMLIDVTKLLSTTNGESKKIKSNKVTVAQQITENQENNIKVTDNIDTNCISIIDKEYDNALKEACKTFDINKSNVLETNKKNNPKKHFSDHDASGSNNEDKKVLNTPIIKQCKEFKPESRRRSARLMAKLLNSSNATNDSFVNLENELSITNKKCNTPIIKTPRIKITPAKNKYQDEKIEGKPMKEYMALRSRMSCLSTPNIKRFNSSMSGNGTHRETEDAKTSVSDKIYAEIYNLYEDSF